MKVNHSSSQGAGGAPRPQRTALVDVLNQALSRVSGGRVLDVATGEGGFVELLVGGLESYTQIVGVDASERAVGVARRTFDQAEIHFIQMDAERLGFKGGCFEVVNTSGSLHHLANVPRVLAEMKRVLAKFEAGYGGASAPAKRTTAKERAGVRKRSGKGR